MKTYQSEQTAKAIASKLAKKDGQEYLVIQAQDGWQVGTQVEFDALTAPQVQETLSEPTISEETLAQQEAHAQEVAGEQLTEADYVVQPKQETKEQVYTIEVTGVHETPMYLIAGNVKGKERWFEKKRLTHYKIDAKTGVAQITMPVAGFKSRDKMKELIAS
jgi:hypothetical protein